MGSLPTRRDIADIRNLVRALWLVFKKGKPTEPVNIGAGKSYSIGWIAERLAQLSRVPVKFAKIGNSCAQRMNRKTMQISRGSGRWDTRRNSKSSERLWTRWSTGVASEY